MNETKVIIYCSDPRPEKANLWKDIKRLIIPQHQRWVPIGLLGGPISLVHHADLPVDLACLIGQIEFALTQFQPKGFVVIGHDCGYYERILRRKFKLDDKIEDAANAAAFLRERFELPAEAHFKKTGSGFDQVY